MPRADTERIVYISNVVNAAENTLYFDLFMQSTTRFNHNPHVKTSVTCRLKKKTTKKNSGGSFCALL